MISLEMFARSWKSGSSSQTGYHYCVSECKSLEFCLVIFLTFKMELVRIFASQDCETPKGKDTEVSQVGAEKANDQVSVFTFTLLASSPLVSVNYIVPIKCKLER